MMAANMSKTLLSTFGNAPYRHIKGPRAQVPIGISDHWKHHICFAAFHGDRIDQAGLITKRNGCGTDFGTGTVHGNGRMGLRLDEVDQPLHGFTVPPQHPWRRIHR